MRMKDDIDINECQMCAAGNESYFTRAEGSIKAGAS